MQHLKRRPKRYLEDQKISSTNPRLKTKRAEGASYGFFGAKNMIEPHVKPVREERAWPVGRTARSPVFVMPREQRRERER